jgi:nucleotide-binding universal stress UspA family protein
MLDHVLVPLDGSDLGEEALVEAKRIIGSKSQITLVTAVDMPEIPLYGFDLVGVNDAPSYQVALEEAITRAREYLQGVVRGLELEGIQTKIVVQFGEPAAVIVETAQELKVDAIVMATHGRSGVSRWLFGSVTSKVLAIAACPVFVIPSMRKQLLLEMDKPEIHYG